MHNLILFQKVDKIPYYAIYFNNYFFNHVMNKKIKLAKVFDRLYHVAEIGKTINIMDKSLSIEDLKPCIKDGAIHDLSF